MIDTALPLLPTRIKDSMNSAKSDLEQIVTQYTKKFDSFDFLDSSLSYEPFLAKLEEAVQLTWLMGELVNNFKICFNQSIFENGILVGIKCLSLPSLIEQYGHLQNLLSHSAYKMLVKIAKNLKTLPLQIGNFPEITKYSDEAQLATGFIELLVPFKTGHHLEINTCQKSKDEYLAELIKVLTFTKNILFVNQFDSIWALYKKYNLNFFGVHSDEKTNLLGSFVSKNISETELKVITDEFEYFLKLEKKSCRFVIKMFFFLTKIDHFVFQENQISLLREAIFEIGGFIRDKKKKN